MGEHLFERLAGFWRSNQIVGMGPQMRHTATRSGAVEQGLPTPYRHSRWYIKYIIDTYLCKPSAFYVPFSGDGFCVIYPTNEPLGRTHLPIAIFDVRGNGKGPYCVFGSVYISKMMNIEGAEIHNSPICLLSKSDYERESADEKLTLRETRCRVVL